MLKDRDAWHAAVRGAAKSQTSREQLNNNALEEGQALSLPLVCDVSQQAPVGP